MQHPLFNLTLSRLTPTHQPPTTNLQYRFDKSEGRMVRKRDEDEEFKTYAHFKTVLARSM